MDQTAYVTVIVRTSQVWLLALASYVLLRSLWRSPALNRLRFVSDHVYFTYALIILLSVAQVVMCTEALLTPVGKLWWMPLICKQLSLFVYLAILECVAGCGGNKR